MGLEGHRQQSGLGAVEKIHDDPCPRQRSRHRKDAVISFFSGQARPASPGRVGVFCMRMPPDGEPLGNFHKKKDRTSKKGGDQLSRQHAAHRQYGAGGDALLKQDAEDQPGSRNPDELLRELGKSRNIRALKADVIPGQAGMDTPEGHGPGGQTQQGRAPGLK